MDEKDTRKWLDYAPRRVRSWKSTLRRAMVIAILAATAWGVWEWGPGIWSRTQTLVWQNRCLNYQLQPGTVVFDWKLPGWDAPAGSIPEPAVAVMPTAWKKLAARYGSVRAMATIFLHQRRLPDGKPVLAAVDLVDMQDFHTGNIEIFAVGSLIRPGSIWAEPVDLCRNYATDTAPAMEMPYDRPGRLRIFAGQCDPADPGRFTFEVELSGRRFDVDGRVSADNRVTLQTRP